MANNDKLSRRKALLRLGTIAAAYAVPTITTITQAHAKRGGSESTSGSATSGSTSGSATSGSTSGSSTAGSTSGSSTAGSTSGSSTSGDQEAGRRQNRRRNRRRSRNGSAD